MAIRTSRTKEGLNPSAETSSKKRKRTIRNAKVYLPDELLQNIFSFLPFKPLARTTLLSKHWNHLSLWRSHPHLDFSPLPRYSPKSMNFVPSVLSRRQPDSNVSTFRLSGQVSYSCLSDCIKHVVNHGIQQLELDLYIDSYSVSVPVCLFGCRTLKVLTLKVKSSEQYKIYYPFVQLRTLAGSAYGFLTSAGFPSVHTLSLTNVYFNLSMGLDLFSAKELPLLRNLCLKNCRGLSDRLRINCPGLEILRLDGLWLRGLKISGIGLLELRVSMCFRYVDSWAKISAPSLKILYWGGVSVEFSVQSLRDLKTSSPCFKYKALDRATLQSASTLLSAICFVTSMIIRSGNGVLETLSKIDSQGGLPYSFNNLTTLELHTKMTKDEITGIVCLLRSSPVLRTVIITANSCSDTENEKWNEKQYWISQIQKLKSIEFHLKVARICVRGTKMHKIAV